MTHTQETPFTDLGAGLANLWFVDTSSHWPVKGPSRPEAKIRKVLIHHHAGFPHDLSVKSKAHPDFPAKYADDFWVSGPYTTKAYGYHYDIPFVEEFSPDGRKRIVYVTSSPDRDHPHTGAGQNAIGVGISLLGTARGPDEWPTSRYYGSKHRAPTEYLDNKGMPSANQRAILPVLVRWLQEKYNIADPHVQAHFQWAKPTCPGYDTERWVMEHEDRGRKQGKGFCYPVALKKSQTTAPFLPAPDKAKSGAAEYLRNTLAGRSGFYPFGRRHFWHNGVHLFPEGGKGTPVHAVRDGWVIAARLDKQVKIKTADGTEVDYGSANFVLVMHEDPGLIDKRDKRTTLDQVMANNTWHTGVSHPLYFSLYMHLETLDDKVAWVKALKDKSWDKAKNKDGGVYAKVLAKPDAVYTFSDVALPVKTGEVIGKVGLHDPFAARPAALTVQHPEIFDAKNHAVLHFEMFSGYNLLERFDTDKAIHKAWTLEDADDNALSEPAASKLDKLTGLAALAPTLADKIKKMEERDPRYQDPSLWSEVIDDQALNALSTIVGHHISEWKADWKKVLDTWFRDWGLAKGKPDKAQKAAAEHAGKVADAFAIKWSWPNFYYRKPALDKHPYFYHPIRLLNWLNGLERTLDDPGLKYNTTDTTAFDISARKVKVVGGADAGKSELVLDAASAQGLSTFATAPNTEFPDRAIVELDLLKGSRFKVAPSKTVYTISTTSKEKAGQRISFAPALESEVKKGDKIEFGLYAWRWERKFTWDTAIVP